MMVIMSVSIVGVYTMVNNGQKLAKLTDDRLIASNLAREWLETISALRDTYLLRASETSGCFFTIDLSSSDPSKCYQTALGTQYALTDNLGLVTTAESLPVCINDSGWYSQEFSQTWTACSDADLCLGSDKKSCRTPFSRSIRFEPCGSVSVGQCIRAHVDIVWWNKPDQRFHLEQIFTKH